MDKQRFSSLLKDPSQVTNSDIKALNEYRKKYPYFQSLYVVVAKALKEREHPKTEAFIKKAAIYSANRSHLKSIIEGEYPDVNSRPSQAIKTVTHAEKPQAKKEETKTAPSPTPPKEVLPKVHAVEQEETKKQTTQTPEAKETEKQKQTKEPTPETKKQSSVSTSTNKEEKVTSEPEPKITENKISQELAEIEATKKRIEALLSGQLEEEEKPKKKSSGKSSGRKKSQIEIIEKFIKDQPQIDKDKIAAAEAIEIEDLAGKSIKEQDAFETETLAKLMVKQGKLKKAEKIYEKLSLKFPEKSTYFASQIQKLKSE